MATSEDWTYMPNPVRIMMITRLMQVIMPSWASGLCPICSRGVRSRNRYQRKSESRSSHQLFRQKGMTKTCRENLFPNRAKIMRQSSPMARMNPAMKWAIRVYPM